MGTGHSDSEIRINVQNMDELSIDSATHLKVNKIYKSRMSNKQQQNSNKEAKELLKIPDSTHLANQRQLFLQQQHQQQQLKSERPHFRIDWRQISYYQKPESYVSKLMSKFVKTGNEPAQNFLDDCVDSASISNGIDYKEINDKKRDQVEPKQILNSLDGCFKSGQLNAILGPSGAGKSTFLSTLFGSKQDNAFGQTKVTWYNENTVVNNNNDSSNKDNTSTTTTTGVKRRPIRIAALPQHDHLLNHLTVYESLMFASKIKNATRSGENTRQKNFHRQNVKRVARMLKLTDCLDTRCGKLSGGQHKRVSIGQELLSEPDVIILDEPTSGLDAMTCLSTIETLKSIVTKHPICIILTIHQPDNDIFTLFDHVYVIAQGGIAIYEGPPENVVPTLAKVNLHLPSPNYNPARFIIEHAFVIEPESYEHTVIPSSPLTKRSLTAPAAWSLEQGAISTKPDINVTSDRDDDDNDDSDDDEMDRQSKHSYIKRSVLSLSEAISGKEMKSNKDKKPLLNIAIQTLDGKLITSEQIARNKERMLRAERWNLLRRLNEIQKSPYRKEKGLINSVENSLTTGRSENGVDINDSGKISPNETTSGEEGSNESKQCNPTTRTTTTTTAKHNDRQHKGGQKALSKERSESDYSSSAWSPSNNRRLKPNMKGGDVTNALRTCRSTQSNIITNKATSLAQLTQPDNNQLDKKLSGRSLELMNDNGGRFIHSNNHNDHNESVIGLSGGGSSDDEEDETSEFAVNFRDSTLKSGFVETDSITNTSSSSRSEGIRTKQVIRSERQFDKLLSARHNCSKQKGYPHWKHSFLLTHRTWLSIVRDPVFFGIQFAMHTTIPILLSAIFGSIQEEGCPRIGNFDLVDFAYSDTENFFQGTVSSIRQSIGNIGIVFFEMFCLIFAINCITAMVFPSDMHVLLKEYRNGWYSLRSYFIGRTIADLPVPIVLHTFGISTLYFLTGQPLTWFRFGGTILLVILASLIAQSIGLTIGAILMTSSQSAVLAAAGIVSPFFALSGFIVRIHTLPIIAQIAAQLSYMYHLLNGFIILRYGFGRCECNIEDFESDATHQIPSNLHTLASMWIGTYSNEYANSHSVSATANNNTATLNGSISSNRTNVDPNIDVVDKMMTAFKMANSYGHQIQDCDDVLPYAMLEFNLRDSDLLKCFIILILMVVLSRIITFSSIYYKMRSFT